MAGQIYRPVVADAEVGHRADLQLRHLISPGIQQACGSEDTGKLKVDYYLSREGKPTGTLLLLAFEAVKIFKPTSPGKTIETVSPTAAT